MNLIYFTKDAYKELRAQLAANEQRYYSSEPWLDEFFADTAIDEYVKTSSVVVPSVSLQCTGDDDDAKNNDDLINIKQLYGAYKDKITPLQASDPMLWSALSHITFRDYVVKRWQKGSRDVNVSARFFATEGRSSLCYYNAISRLWWAGYLSYDKDREDTNPWWLTETMLSAQQIFKDYTDQGFSMSRTVSIGLLRALKRIQEESDAKQTTVFRMCCDSYLNHYGAVSMLDFLSSDEVEAIAYDFMKTKVRG